VKIARPEAERISEAERLLSSVMLIRISDPILRRAAGLSSAELRTLDAVHLATAERVGVTEILTYDRRLSAAAEQLGLRVASPA
jgi:predicted nucleic acid-binding protein